MPRKVEILDLAVLEAIEARMFYEQRDSRLAVDFKRQLDSAVAAIVIPPTVGQRGEITPEGPF